MRAQETFLMAVKDLKRCKVIEQTIEKKLKQRDAAELLDLSTRQVKRLAKRLRREGPKGLIHRLRGQRSNRRHPDTLRKKVIHLYQGRYMGFGPTLLEEKLKEE